RANQLLLSCSLLANTRWLQATHELQSWRDFLSGCGRTKQRQHIYSHHEVKNRPFEWLIIVIFAGYDVFMSLFGSFRHCGELYVFFPNARVYLLCISAQATNRQQLPSSSMSAC